jgi:ABC-type transport system substrate-binding protein
MLRQLYIEWKASLIGGFFVVCSAVLFACTNVSSSDKMVFRYNEPAGIPTLDPAFARDKSTIWAVQQLYEGLVMLNEHNEVVPALSESWSIDSTGTSYTFLLREAEFHSGRKVTANDVRYSLNRLKDPNIASPGSWVLERVMRIDAHGDRSLTITLDRPYSSLLSLLTMPYCSVVDTTQALELATHGGGSGPFKFHRWHLGQKLILHRNDNYWGLDSLGQTLPYLDGISISFLPDQQSAFLEYLSGNLEIVPNIDPSFKDDLLTRDGLLQSKYMEDHRLERSPFLNTEYLVFNADMKLPKDLRWAIQAAIDREVMIKSLRSGIGIPAKGGIIPFGLKEHQSNIGVNYQKDSAESIISRYDTLPDLTLVTVSNYRDLCEFVQGALSEVGWDIEINIVPSATLRSDKSAGSIGFFRASWIADYPDAENYLMLFFSGLKAPNGPNYSRYDNPLFDSLYQELSKSTSEMERVSLARKADRLLMNDAACVPLYYDEVLRLLPNRVSGLKTNALNALILKEVQLDVNLK